TVATACTDMLSLHDALPIWIAIDDDGAMEIASRSRGTPRIANRLLKRARDFAEVMGNGVITVDTAKIALGRMEIDELGLDNIDQIGRAHDRTPDTLRARMPS